MNNIILEILSQLKLVGFGCGLFVLAYISNILFSTYYNVSLLKEKFQASKLLESLIKVLMFVFGTTILSIGVTLVPIFCEYCGLALPEIYVDVFQSLAIVAVFLITAIKYLVEAFNKFKLILDYKKEETAK